MLLKLLLRNRKSNRKEKMRIGQMRERKRN
jgi:hypothetical protein